VITVAGAGARRLSCAALLKGPLSGIVSETSAVSSNLVESALINSGDRQQVGLRYEEQTLRSIYASQGKHLGDVKTEPRVNH
jgi:hypothetical protein